LYPEKAHRNEVALMQEDKQNLIVPIRKENEICQNTDLTDLQDESDLVGSSLIMALCCTALRIHRIKD
jgi:hypothetical protein